MINHKEFAKKMANYSVLYVEDDLKIRTYIEEFLNRYFKNIYTCESAEEALLIYKKNDPDILLLDISLPGKSGIDFAEFVRTANRRSRIILLTAYTNTEFMLKAVELELTRYLVKPVTSEDLLMALEKCANELRVDNITNLGNGKIYSKKLASIISNNRKLALRKREVDILDYFIEHEGEVLSYETLDGLMWSDEYMSRNAIRAQIKNLRQKIGKEAIENIPGVGYMFKVSHDT